MLELATAENQKCAAALRKGEGRRGERGSQLQRDTDRQHTPTHVHSTCMGFGVTEPSLNHSWLNQFIKLAYYGPLILLHYKHSFTNCQLICYLPAFMYIYQIRSLRKKRRQKCVYLALGISFKKIKLDMFSRFFIHSKKPAPLFLYYCFLTLIWDIKKLCTYQQAGGLLALQCVT